MKIKIRHFTVIIAIILIIILLAYHFSTIEKKALAIHDTLIDKETYTDYFGNPINATYFHIELTLTNLETYDISNAYIHFSLILENNSVIEPNLFPLFQYAPEIISEGSSKRFQISFFINNENNLPKELKYTYEKTEYTGDLINYTDANNNDQAIIILGIIALISVISLVIWTIDVKKTKDEKENNKCIICFRDIPKEEELFCKSWKTKTRICNNGPFCSKECINKHINSSVHDQVLGSH